MNKARVIPLTLAACLLFMAATALTNAQEPVTLKVMAVSGHEAFNAAIRAQESGFNEKYDNIEVEIEIIPASWPQFTERFTVMVAAGVAPDLVAGGAGAFKQFARSGLFVPIDKYIQRDGINLDDFFPGPLSATVVDGKYYSLPGGTSTRAVAYSKDMFAERGLAEIPDDWKWHTDVVQIARRLTDRESDPPTYGLAFWVWHGAHHLGDIAGIIWDFGGDILNADQTEFTLNSPGSTEAMEYIIDLINEYRVFPDDFDALGHFMAGNLGMWFAGTWDAQILADAPFNVGWAPQPGGPVADTTTAGGGPSYTITSQSEHPDEAWEFIKFVTSPEGQMLTPDMPSHRGAVEHYLSNSPPYENREAFIDNLARSRLIVWPERMSDVYNVLNESGWKEMLTGEIPYNSWVDEVTPRVNAILQSK